MRAREFITEQKDLPVEEGDPLRYTYELPGVTTADPYRTYRVGVAIARARSDATADDLNPYRLPWSAETALGKYAVVSGTNSSIDPIIDTALKMTNTPGGKRLVGTAKSTEPDFVQDQSPIKAFAGYPR
jgi:hypothetical protein